MMFIISLLVSVGYLRRQTSADELVLAIESIKGLQKKRITILLIHVSTVLQVRHQCFRILVEDYTLTFMLCQSVIRASSIIDLCVSNASCSCGVNHDFCIFDLTSLYSSFWKMSQDSFQHTVRCEQPLSCLVSSREGKLVNVSNRSRTSSDKPSSLNSLKIKMCQCIVT